MMSHLTQVPAVFGAIKAELKVRVEMEGGPSTWKVMFEKIMGI